MNSPGIAAASRARMLLVLLWTLFPIAAIWLGLYQLKSALVTFALYHGVCLMPAIIWGRKLWASTFSKPRLRDCVLLFLASILFCAITVVMYELIGTKLLSNENALSLIKQFGSNKGLLGFLSVYAVVVNPLVEELFWRGVVLNEVDNWHTKYKHFGLVWSSGAYALFHYLIFRLVLFPIFAEIGILMLAFYGGFLAIVYRKTGSILTTAIAHGLLTDMAAVALIVDLLRHRPNFM
jgi:membrane protease YdiL (CAAX protease family)